MRNKYRIVNLLTLFATGWSKVPDMRFGQVIENLKRYSGKEDLFYLEDDEMEKLRLLVLSKEDDLVVLEPNSDNT